MEVTQFTALARSEFAAGKLAADEKPFPAGHEQFTTALDSKSKVETHTYMSNLPRLHEFKGYTPFARLINKEYTVANKEFRVGVAVKKTDVDDDQTGGYMKTINGLPTRARKDTGHKILAHLAAGGSTPCFDGSNFFANSHVFGTGDNLDTFDAAASDGATHKIIALVTDNPAVKPVLYQDREPLGNLDTDANDSSARLQMEYQYWVDCRFGLGYGFWWDALHLTISDTPTVAECYTIIEQLVNGFRSFKLPKANDVDEDLFVHEGWDPTPANFVLCCNLKLGVVLKRALALTQYTSPGGNVDNVYKDVATVVPTSALGA
ncbi:MAG TPA: Mu-like prophage major head subunit gpT family protein [Gemmata sp.]